jgi:hypothetical protein
MKLTTHLLLRLRVKGFISLIPLYTFIAWTGKTLLLPLILEVMASM